MIAQILTGCVVSVGDGDTIRVATDGKTITVRLACINSAETAQPPFGKASADRLRQLLPPGQQVALRVADTDRYGRSVAKVYKGDLSINLALVQEGQAIEMFANEAFKERHGQLPNRQPFSGTQAFAYPKDFVQVLDATIKGVVKQGAGIETSTESLPQRQLTW